MRRPRAGQAKKNANSRNLPVSNQTKLLPRPRQGQNGKAPVHENNDTDRETPRPQGISLHTASRFAEATSAEKIDLVRPEDDNYPIVPTNMVRYGPGIQREPTRPERIERLISDMSPNYKGDPGNQRLHSDICLLPELSCSFWITGLPKNVTHKEIFDKIRASGPVYLLHINNKEALAGRRKTAAAKLVFKDLDGASRFYNKTVLPREANGRGGGLKVRGRRAIVVRNRVKVGAQHGLHHNCTRVLRISGPPKIVNYDYLVAYFSSMFRFELEDVIDYSVNKKLSILEFRFAAFRAQGTLAVKAVRRDHRFRRGFPRVRVQYAPDPCASE